MRLIGTTTLFLGALAHGLAAAAEPTISEDLALEKLQAPDALTALRSLAGVRELEIVDERTVRVTSDADTVADAKIVIEVSEHPSLVASEIPTRELSDGAVIACVRLQHASALDVMKALRRLRIARLAASPKLSTVAIRDTREQVAKALEVVREMEEPRGQ